MMDEDAISNLSVRVKLSLTVWDFILPATPSLPAVIGVSCIFAYFVIIFLNPTQPQPTVFMNTKLTLKSFLIIMSFVIYLDLVASLLLMCVIKNVYCNIVLLKPSMRSNKRGKKGGWGYIFLVSLLTDIFKVHFSVSMRCRCLLL